MEPLIYKIREDLQMRILSELFRHTKRQEIILKGGMAMRIIAKSIRYTKDIDLDASPMTEAEQAREYVRASIRSATMAVSGYIRNIKITEPKQTDTTLRWKINGFLADTNEPFNLTVEVSRRGFLAKDHFITTMFVPSEEYNLPPAMVESYDIHALLVSKIGAMLNDRRDAPRDPYDISVLFAMNANPGFELMKKGLFEKYNMTPDAVMDKIWKKLDMINWNRFREEVLSYMPGFMTSRFTEEYFNEFIVNVGEKLNSLVMRGCGCGEFPEEEEDNSSGNCPGGMR